MSINELNWDNNPLAKFKYPDMVEIEVPPDGSCFFHSICLAFYKPYIFSEIGNIKTQRSDIIKQFRHELSVILGESDENGITIYDTLSNGNLKLLGKEFPNEYSLQALQKMLDSNESIDHSVHEFISNEIGKDIYFLESDKMDVYKYGKDLSLLYKKRPSIVLMHHNEHFNLVGIKNQDSTIDTYFDANHPFISEIIDNLNI